MIDGQGHIKLIDFGFAKILKGSSSNTNSTGMGSGLRTYTNCGTLGYTAPEVLTANSQGYSF